MQTANLYLYYRHANPEDVSHPICEMKYLYTCVLGDIDQVRVFRRYMRNCYAWAVGPRLQAMKEAINRLYEVPLHIHTGSGS